MQPPAKDAGGQPILRAYSGGGRSGWWNDTVFYEVFVRSFADSDTGPLAGDGIGDIEGLIENLDYLNDGNPNTSNLGVTGLWLMPICPSPSYHGYDITDYKDVNKQYGTIEDFRRLMTEAHKRGIKVIIDWVPNHTSSKHPWFLEAMDPKSQKHDWYIWSPTDPGYKGPWHETVWHKLKGDSPTPWYYGIFSSQMPDLNYRNPDVTKAMTDAAAFWLKSAKDGGAGADGFRIDAVRHLIEDGQIQENTPETHAWLKDFHKAYKQISPSAMTVGEVWAGTDVVATYVPDQLDLGFEFDLSSAIIGAVKEGKSDRLEKTMAKIQVSYPPNQFATFLSNHDQTRVLTQLGGRIDDAKLAATLLLTLPGVPFIYYGEEIGMTGDKPDEDIRTPMQWTAGPNAGFTKGTPWRPVNKGYEAVNVEAEWKSGLSLFDRYRQLTRLRQQTQALRTGTFLPIQSDTPGVYAFMRCDEAPTADGKGTQTQAVVVVLNLSDEQINKYALSRGVSPLRGPQTAELKLGKEIFRAPKPDSVGGFKDYKAISPLPPKSAFVMVLAPRDIPEQPGEKPVK